ncbi:MDR family MFS transporter [Gordonia sp. (in: high G+C Gram-positive bacteria)]|uniref:MDR family MFS transporter n=1 Tax=Gordonia sp. (in: high G+C Gram-positive bacteria) TaxID=84139 RepID=UPI0039E4E181
MTTATPTAGPNSISVTRRNWIFVTIMIAMLLAALDQTIVSTALPTIVGDLGGGGHMSWVVTSYMLAETVSVVLAGKFGDLWGRKNILIISIVVFIVGSFFCGLSENMVMLIAFRAIQGIGAGGITVTATALIADVIPLRERGKYQGAMGAVFGVTTVVGPLMGGLFTDHLSWRWAFYVNVPIAVIVVALALKTIPGLSERVKTKIDYLGIVFVALGAVGLTLGLSWGGSEYAWGSPTIIGLFVGSVVAFIVFVFVELRAVEPILPMHLFRNRVFSVASILSFIVGFAMLGSMTFLPSFLQYVQGTSATESGVRMLPMVIGLLLTSITSGTIVGRTGKYKPFPIIGSAVIALGLYLLSTMDEHTSILVTSIYIFVLGLGIGLIMQILVLVVQNTANYEDLGTATSAITFFRTLGMSFGAAVMGTIYANLLKSNMPAAMMQAHIVNPADVDTPAKVHALADDQRQPLVHAFADTLQNVFLWVVPVALVAFVVSWFLPQRPMRQAAKESATGASEGFAVPDSTTSDTVLETIIGRVLAGHNRRDAFQQALTASGSKLDIPTAWGLMRAGLPPQYLGTALSQGAIEQRIGIPDGVLTSFYNGIVNDGYLKRDGELLVPTAAGEKEIRSIMQAWRDWLVSQVHEWLPDEVDDAKVKADVTAALTRIGQRALEESELPSGRHALRQ